MCIYINIERGDREEVDQSLVRRSSQKTTPLLFDLIRFDPAVLSLVLLVTEHGYFGHFDCLNGLGSLLFCWATFFTAHCSYLRIMI